MGVSRPPPQREAPAEVVDDGTDGERHYQRGKANEGGDFGGDRVISTKILLDDDEEIVSPADRRYCQHIGYKTEQIE
jgi:hypothetical protein